MSHHGANSTFASDASRPRRAAVPSALASAVPPLDGDDIDGVFDRLASLLNESEPPAHGGSSAPSNKESAGIGAPAKRPITHPGKSGRPSTQNKILEPSTGRPRADSHDSNEPARAASSEPARAPTRDEHVRVTLRAPRLDPQPRPFPTARIIQTVSYSLPPMGDRHANLGPPPLPKSAVVPDEPALRNTLPATPWARDAARGALVEPATLQEPRRIERQAEEVKARAWNHGARAAAPQRRRSKRALVGAALGAVLVTMACFIGLRLSDAPAEAAAPSVMAHVAPTTPAQAAPTFAAPTPPVVELVTPLPTNAAPAAPSSAVALVRPDAPPRAAKEARPEPAAARKPPPPPVATPAPPAPPAAAIAAPSKPGTGRLLD